MTQELGIIALIKRGVRVLTANGDDLTDSGDPSRVMMRQIAGSFAEYEKARLVSKLKGARERKRTAAGKCEGRKSHAELRPDVVALARRPRRKRPKGGQGSSGSIAPSDHCATLPRSWRNAATATSRAGHSRRRRCDRCWCARTSGARTLFWEAYGKLRDELATRGDRGLADLHQAPRRRRTARLRDAYAGGKDTYAYTATQYVLLRLGVCSSDEAARRAVEGCGRYRGGHAAANAPNRLGARARSAKAPPGPPGVGVRPAGTPGGRSFFEQWDPRRRV